MRSLIVAEADVRDHSRRGRDSDFAWLASTTAARDHPELLPI
jgi:hypothetical protein